MQLIEERDYGLYSSEMSPMVVMSGNMVIGRFGVVSESFSTDPQAQGGETPNLEWCEFFFEASPLLACLL